MELDHGAVLRKETGLTTPKIVRFVIGNPLVMKEIAKHVPDAGAVRSDQPPCRRQRRWRSLIV